MAIKTSLSGGGPSNQLVGSVFFNGTTSYLSIANNAALNIMSSGPFTIEFWVWPGSAGGTPISKTDGDTNGNGFWIDINAAGYVSFKTINGTGYSAATVTYNAWNHMAFVRDGTNAMTTYINGVVGGSSFVTQSTDTTGPMEIGRKNSTGGNYFPGYISNLRIVKGVNLYPSTFIPPTSPLTAIANTSLLTCQGPTLKDASSNNFTITKNGSAAENGLSPFTESVGTLTLSTTDNVVLSFNGGNNQISIADSAILEPEANNFCIEFWFYTTVDDNHYIVIKGSGSAGSTAFTIIRQNTWLYRTDDVSITYSHSTVEINRWNHYALCRNGSNISIFINGQRRDTSSTIFTVGQAIKNVTDNLRIGSAAAGQFFGYISNFRFVINDSVYDPLSTSINVPNNSLRAIPNTVLLIGADGPTIKDLSVNNFNITFSGASIVNVNQFDVPQLTESVFESGSFYFDGSGDYLTAPTNAAFSFGTGDFTIEGWVYYAALTNSGIFQIGATLFPGTNGIGLGLDATNPPFWLLYYGNGAQTTTTIKPLTNTWYHFAVVRSSSTTRLYINGVATSISLSDAVNYTGTVLGIGGIYSTAYIMNGYLSNFRIVKGTALYTSNFTPRTNLTNVPNTSLLLKAVRSDLWLKDDSVNNFALTPNGNAAYNSFSPETTTRSFSTYFDGTGDYLTIPSNYTMSGDFTAEAFVYNTGANNPCILGTLDSANSQLLRISGGVQIAFLASTITGTITVPSNQWVHLAISRQGTTVRLFTNGVLSQTATYGGNALFRYIGALGVGTDLLTGYVSNLRVIDGTALYTSNFIPSNWPLTAIANTVLLTCQDQTIRDASTNNFTITKNGNTTWNALTPFNNIATYKLTDSGLNLNTIDEVTLNSGSLYFDGTGDFLTVPSNTAFVMGTGDFCIECWIFTNAAPGGGATNDKTIFGSFNFTPSFFLFLRNSDNAPAIWNGTTQLNSTLVVTANTWTHVAWVRSGGNFTFYVNGLSGGTSSYTTNWTAADISYIGRSNADTTRNFQGYISNLRVVKGTALYTSNFTPPAAILDPITSTSLLLNCLVDGEFKDSSTNNFSLTRNGNVGPSTFSPFYQNTSGSLYFDGTGDFLTIASSTVFGLSTGNFTIEGWFYPNSNPANGPGTLFDFRTGATATATAMRINSSLQIMFYNGPSNIETSFTSVVTNLNAWNHIAYVRISGTVYGYINGRLAGSVAVASDLGTTAPLMIGNNQTAGYSFYGYMSNIRIIKGTALYTGNFVPSRSALTSVSNTSLLLNTASAATDIRDSSPNNFTVTRNGNTVFSNFTPVSNAAQKLYKDGTVAVKEFVESNIF